MDYRSLPIKVSRCLIVNVGAFFLDMKAWLSKTSASALYLDPYPRFSKAQSAD